MSNVQSTSVNGQPEHTCWTQPFQPCPRCEQFKPVLEAVEQQWAIRLDKTTRLVRLADWEAGAPYAILAQENNRIIRLGISINRAAEYLRDAGLREFDVDYSLYQAELWARREGSYAPLYGLDEREKPTSFNVLTASVDER